MKIKQFLIQLLNRAHKNAATERVSFKR